MANKRYYVKIVNTSIESHLHLVMHYRQVQGLDLLHVDNVHQTFGVGRVRREGVGRDGRFYLGVGSARIDIRVLSRERERLTCRVGNVLRLVQRDR